MNSVSVNIMIVKVKLLLIVKKWLTPYCSRVSYSIPYIGGFIAYFFLGIGSCFGGLSLKCLINRPTTLETERTCFLLVSSRKFFVDSVILITNISDFFSFILYIQCMTIYLANKEDSCYTLYDNLI